MLKARGSSIGRRNQELEDILGKDPFLVDLAKLLKSKSYRRLDFKAQVFCSPENPHVRTRKTHTEEVIGNAALIAAELGLNVYLCMAIAAGHDIGHTPYGHPGEKMLSKLGGKPFKHNIFGTVVAQEIERKGKGLNLTFETLQGMFFHARGKGDLVLNPDTLPEYNAIMYADKISYVPADLNDMVRQGYMEDHNPPLCAMRLGHNQRAREVTLINALVEESVRKGYVSFSEGQVFEDFEELRSLLYQIYPQANNIKKVRYVLASLYDYFSDKGVLGELRERYAENERFENYFTDNGPILKVDPVVAIALLTDHEADKFYELLSKSERPPIEEISQFGVFETLPYLHNKDMDYSQPNLRQEDFTFSA